jgi:predicted acyltransferase
MIISSYPGKYGISYSPFILTSGYGWSLPDLVVPSFLWTIGYSLNISISKRRSKGLSDIRLFMRIIYRSIALFSIGMGLHLMPCIDKESWIKCIETIRVFGVFQRISLAYLLAAPLALLLKSRAQFVVLLVTLIGYEAMWQTAGHIPDCDETYRWSFWTTFPGLCYILCGTLSHRYLSKRTHSEYIWIGALSFIVILIAIYSQPYYPFCYQRLNANYVLFSSTIFIMIYALINCIPMKILNTFIARIIIALGMNPLMIYLFSAVIWEASHAIGLSSYSSGWLSIWELSWKVLSTFMGSEQFASLLMSSILLVASSVLAAVMAHKGVFLKL